MRWAWWRFEVEKGFKVQVGDMMHSTGHHNELGVVNHGMFYVACSGVHSAPFNCRLRRALKKYKPFNSLTYAILFV